MGVFRTMETNVRSRSIERWAKLARERGVLCLHRNGWKEQTIDGAYAHDDHALFYWFSKLQILGAVQSARDQAL